ncbi:hypothetical protein JV16_01822 [Anoxybacillus ayderensis]|uniref:Uncharacterized protein n=1 Tax=Anoxybacillus ayderensis TaxID=265546 RepID=A0A0D0G6F1_9BACL|nr:hypothetical protein C289_2823 [Anoxybacillus ayderensis]KIP20920.1 hypothetical protein JV16_01822 [Anoxybacillus ayderensis]
MKFAFSIALRLVALMSLLIVFAQQISYGIIVLFRDMPGFICFFLPIVAIGIMLVFRDDVAFHQTNGVKTDRSCVVSAEHSGYVHFVNRLKRMDRNGRTVPILRTDRKISRIRLSRSVYKIHFRGNGIIACTHGTVGFDILSRSTLLCTTFIETFRKYMEVTPFFEQFFSK